MDKQLQRQILLVVVENTYAFLKTRDVTSTVQHALSMFRFYSCSSVQEQNEGGPKAAGAGPRHSDRDSGGQALVPRSRYQEDQGQAKGELSKVNN